jgi:alpha-1,6-mannosyltransferase
VKATFLGCAVALLLCVATAAASWSGSPLRAGAPEGSDLPSTAYLLAAGCAFAVYLLALPLLRRRGASLVVVCAVAAAIQLVPLAGPLLLSRDVYAYWDYGRLAAVHDANPYAVPPARFPHDPARRAMAPAWRGAKSVYGPLFTAASAGLATTGGRSSEAAAFGYRLAAGTGMVALALVSALVAPVPAFAAAFVGWNPLLAVDFAGGGHNDVWMMVFVLGGLALAVRRPRLAGVSWAFAAAVKWMALALLPLELLGASRREALRTGAGFVLAASAVAAAACVFFGTAWLTALAPFAHEHAGWAVPSRLGELGLPGWLAFAPLVLSLPWLVRSARAGRPRLGLAAGLVLLASPWLLPWYAVWAVPLAAVDEDRSAWLLSLGMCAYLLADRVPI